MTAPDARGRRTARWRLAGIGLLALGVAAALYVAGRLHQSDYTFSMFGADPFPPKALLATIALALAGVQVLLALWIYRKLPLVGGPPRPVPVAGGTLAIVLGVLWYTSAPWAPRQVGARAGQCAHYPLGAGGIALPYGPPPHQPPGARRITAVAPGPRHTSAGRS